MCQKSGGLPLRNLAPPLYFSGGGYDFLKFLLATIDISGRVIDMYKEKFIAENFNINKAKLVELRKSGVFEIGEDYVKKDKKNGTFVILWTEKGLNKLVVITGASSNGRKPDLQSDNGGSTPPASTISGCVVQGSEPTAHNGQDAGSTPAAPTETVPAIVRSKYPNKRLVRCEIRGETVNVAVRDSSPLRVNSIINARHRGGRWVGDFRVASNGRVFIS